MHAHRPVLPAIYFVLPILYFVFPIAPGQLCISRNGPCRRFRGWACVAHTGIQMTHGTRIDKAVPSIIGLPHTRTAAAATKTQFSHLVPPSLSSALTHALGALYLHRLESHGARTLYLTADGLSNSRWNLPGLILRTALAAGSAARIASTNCG